MRVDRRKDPRRRAAVDVAIALAELNASWDDYERALEHLRAADELAGGALAERFTSERDEWALRLGGAAEGACGRPPTAITTGRPPRAFTRSGRAPG